MKIWFERVLVGMMLGAWLWFSINLALATSITTTGAGGAVAGPPPPPDVSHTFVGTVISTSNATTYNLTSPNLGPGQTGQAVIYSIVSNYVGGSMGGGNVGVNTTSVDGNSASVVVPAVVSLFDEFFVSMAAVFYSGGGAPTISVTFEGSADNCALGVWTADNLSSITPTDTDTAAANSFGGQAGGVSVATEANGFAVATSGDYLGTNAVATWSGISEQFEEFIESLVDGDQVHSGADTDTDGSTLNASVSWNSDDGPITPVVVLGSFGNP